MMASGACSYGDYHRFDYEFKVSILKDKSLTWAQISSQADYQNQDQSKASKHSSFCISRRIENVKTKTPKSSEFEKVY
jgi:hypothetical protein